MVEIYRHVGEKVRADLQKRGNLPANKTALLMSKFDDMRASGDMMLTATMAVGTTDGRKFLMDKFFKIKLKACSWVIHTKIKVPAM